MAEKGKIALSVIAVGGNNEVALAKSDHGQTLRELTIEPPSGGKLAEILLAPFPQDFKKSVEVDCTYYSWTGTPRADEASAFKTPLRNLNGAEHIYNIEKPKRRQGALVIVGWSNGGDTAYKLAKRMGKVDLLITLDPVSRLTSLHWLPFNGSFRRPDNVVLWLHAYPTSWGQSRKRVDEGSEPGSLLSLKEIWFRARNGFYEMPNPVRWLDPRSPHSGNMIAVAGGAWDSQPKANENIAVGGNHGDTKKMLGALVSSGSYVEFIQRVRVTAAL